MVGSAPGITSAPTLPLSEIQGNLLGFFKPFQRFVFLRFRDAATTQGFVRVVIREIDTCAHVAEFRRRFKWNKDRARPVPTSRWFNLLLSSRGLYVLDASERGLFERSFRDGMRSRANDLGDRDLSSPEHWVTPFQEEVHAMAILASDDAEGIEALHASLRRHARARAHPVEELGAVDGVAREGEHHGHEHFGFLDGISQPGV